MTARMDGRRRAAFLRGLEVCGNVTVAAERACVSRSWVVGQRRREAGFDAACRAASDAARARLLQARDNAPPEGWGHLDGIELVVRGTGGGPGGSGSGPSPGPGGGSGGGGSGEGRRVQVARARAGQISAAREDRFLAVLAATCNVKAALAAAGITKRAMYSHRQRWPAFAARWDAAVEEASALLSWALVAHACNPMSSPALPAGRPIVAMSVDETLHNLYMHQYAVSGVGRRPGRREAPYDLDAAVTAVLRNIDAIERGEAVGPARRAEVEAALARRRRGGLGGEEA